MLGVTVLVPSSWDRVAHLVHVAAGEPHPLGVHGSPRTYFHGVVLGAWHAAPMDPSWDGEVLGHAWAERMSPGVMLLDRAPEGHELALAFSSTVCPHEQLVEEHMETLVQVGEPFMRQEETLVRMHQA